MAYVLDGSWAWNAAAPVERRAETALEALEAFIAYLREDHRALIQDEAGRMMLPAELLREALQDTPEARLVAVLADYASTLRDREVDWLLGRFTILASSEYEAGLKDVEAHGTPTADRRRADADELERLDGVLFNQRSYWRLAGAAWVRDFHELPPAEVVTELRRRHPRTDVNELRNGAEEQLRRYGGRPPRYQALPSPDGRWGVWDNEACRFARRWVHEGVARAHADALDDGRPWTEKDYGRELDLAVQLSLRRRQGRMRWAQRWRPTSPAPPSPPTPRRGSGPRP